MTPEELQKAQNALTEKQRNFVEFWLQYRNAAYAYEKAYNAARMAPSTIYVQAHRLLKSPKVAPIIEARLTALGEELTDETEFTVLRVLQQYIDLSQADPNEVAGVRTGACRHCWGEGHGYHWKEHEYAEAVTKADQAGEPLPDPAGGFGYRFTADANPDCPVCEGLGAEYQAPVDTSKLSPGGRLLYAGVKPTNNGLEIKIRDRDKALENAAKIIGAFTERLDLTVKGGVKVENVTPENAAELYKEMIK